MIFHSTCNAPNLHKYMAFTNNSHRRLNPTVVTPSLPAGNLLFSRQASLIFQSCLCRGNMARTSGWLLGNIVRRTPIVVTFRLLWLVCLFFHTWSAPHPRILVLATTGKENMFWIMLLDERRKPILTSLPCTCDSCATHMYIYSLYQKIKQKWLVA